MSGPLRLLPGEGDSLPALPRQRKEPRARPSWAADPIDELADRLMEPVSAAVHPYEVAALLESDGLTGDQITTRYARSGLFTLAEDLYARVPRHYPEPPPTADPWRPDHLRCALRGLVFALPGLAYVLGPGLLDGPHAVRGLVAAGLTAWAWNQALSHRAYLRLGTTGPAAAGRTLRLGAPAGALLATVAGLLLAGPGTAGAFAAGQSCYLGAATVLLVLGRERALLAALSPVTAGAAALPWWQPPGAVAAALLLATAGLAALAAAHAVRAALRSGPAPAGATPPLTRSLPYGLFGLAAGVLAMLTGAVDPYAVVVLTLSMGFAEWLLYRYRGLAVAALRASTQPRDFTLRAARALALCLSAYVVLLAAGAVFAGAGAAPLLGLGAVLWTALLLQAFGVAWPPAAVCLTAAAGEAAATAAGLPTGPVQLVCRCAAALVLLFLACRILGRPTAHR
ncbi:hypothetical protein AR457_31500 [Streptomyces agglomeratus]|uniref:hypothetical protein n=1 Tax=Streptomyces agglomeratus TaxID=285458 RepID=UPI0008528148|nr:hypothetical protein [Streptomyces agglomeratus]OEJ37614.1 hypothetical protein BGK70_05145 [Streptomyces agglomeratus]OEJ48000.1 hypothetical protein AR457_31500 [Streptomyces agglomeratus]OEJ50153.1 hypothetical protein BGK72_04660 [Streptomyces agglomeratus]OEJ57481.1 hypothetical protein BGM19_05340 [Streptomyces agglomeratus]